MRLILERRPADAEMMLRRILITASWVCCALVAASFALFVHDQLAAGSSHQQALVSSTAATPVPVAHRAGQPRRLIEAAAHDLTAPFDSIVASDSGWVTHGVPSLIALLVYGGGLGFAARSTSGRA